MKIIYMGTPDFAVPSLEALYRAGHEICAVVTQPDAKRDRGKKVTFTPVKEKAVELGIEVLQPEKLKNDREVIAKMKAMNPDFITVAAYGQILPKEVLDIPEYGCINVHGSLLPRWRGAAPIQRAIMEGDSETGVTIMYMEEGLDTGDMLAKVSTPIDRKTAEQLHDELAEKGAELLAETLPKIADGSVQPEKQDDSLSTYAPMIFKKEGKIDFSRSPEEIECLIRAFDSWPGAYADLNDKTMKIWSAEPLQEENTAEPGTITKVSEEGIRVSAGGRTLLITRIQMPGKKRVKVADFLKGNSIEEGTVLR